jgi:DNA-directed RNA polymerase subunit beta
MTPRSLKKLAEAGVKAVLVGDSDLLGRFAAEDVVNMTTGEVFAEAGDEITEDLLAKFEAN